MPKPVFAMASSANTTVGKIASDEPATVYFTTEGGALNALQKQRPLAVGPWTTFHALPSGWGRALSVNDLQARTAARRAAATAAIAALKPAGT